MPAPPRRSLAPHANTPPNGASTTAPDRLARRRAALKMGWLIHASVYLLVNLLLTSLSLYQGRHWAVFPALGWGAGLLAHALAVYVASGGSRLYERMVQREHDLLRAGHTRRNRTETAPRA